MKVSRNQRQRSCFLTIIDIVHLRDYKSYVVTDDTVLDQHEISARRYLEYSPYGNIQDLIDRYRAFNRYLPELFLWHAFNSLARAICEFEEAQAQQEIPKRILHLDLKPPNIFLGYEKNSPDPSTGIMQSGGLFDLGIYPTLRVGDFGLAVLQMTGTSEKTRTIGASTG